MSTLWQTFNKDRKKLSQDIKTLLDAACVTDWLGPGQAPVLLKPNLVVSKPASGGATTHPEIAAAVIEYLQDCGYSRIGIAESSWVGDSTARAYKKCGYTELAERYNISLIDLKKDSSTEVRTPDGVFRICSAIAELQETGGSLINLPVLKGHGQTLVTCALKNLKGCIPDSEKRRYHSLGVHNPVAILNTIIKPAFALVDGLNGDPTWEEGGSPLKRDLLLLGRDPVSIDLYACSLLNIRPEAVQYIGMAENLGVGTGAAAETDIRFVNAPESVLSRHSDKHSTAPETEIRKWISSIVDQRSACSACFGNLAGALRELRKAGNNLRIDSRKEKTILIGQDFKGESIPGGKIGIGSCTCGGNTGIPDALQGCPPSQASIREFLSR